LELAAEKWGGIPLYRGEVTLLGEAEHGSWWWGPKGRTISRGDEPLFVAQQDVVFLVVPGAWWSATWWWEHPEVDLYVNIGTPFAFEAERLVSTDLDLDVIRRCDGQVEIIDQDEFEEHQVRYGYPADVVTRVAQTAEEVRAAIERGGPPFDPATPQRWVARARGA